MKSLLEPFDIEIYLPHGEEKSVVVEWFITTLKNKISKFIIKISNNVYTHKLPQ